MPFRSKFIKAEDLTEFISTTRKRYALGLSADKEDRDEAQEDQRFEAGGLNQWDPASIALRTEFHRPICTENRLHIFVQQVVNDGRQRKPAIAISALDGGKKETADIIQSRIRQIEYESDADIAYDTSREQQIVSGRGWYRVTTEYQPHSFEQVIRIKRIENQFSVVWDPFAKEHDKSDAEWMFVISTISRDDYKRKYGEDTELAGSNFVASGDATTWVNLGGNAEQVQEAEYWLKVHKKRTLCLLSTGQIEWKDELLKDVKYEIVDEREADDVTVQQFIIDGVGILDETEWLGSLIPIVPVWGREEFIDGKRRTFSLIRHAKDPQRRLNLLVTNFNEQIAQMPKTPWMGPEGFMGNHEAEWESINTVPRAAIQWKPISIGGQIIGKPERMLNEPPIQALVIGITQTIDAIKASMGLFDTSLGARSNETSGIAIQRRQREADNANFHFSGNEARSRKHLGDIILELIDKIDRKKKSWVVRSEDGKTKTVPINQKFKDEEIGTEIEHVIDSKFYGVAVSTGPSFTSQRQEGFDKQSQLLSTLPPQVGSNFIDIMMRNSDMPGAEQWADRAEKMLPPELQPPKEGKQQPLPPQVQQAMEQGKQTMMQLTEQVHALKDQLDSKKPEIEARLAIANMQEETKRLEIQAQVEIAQLNAGQRSAIENLRLQAGAVQHSIDSARDDAQRAVEAARATQTGSEATGVQGAGQPTGEAPIEAQQPISEGVTQ